MAFDAVVGLSPSAVAMPTNIGSVDLEAPELAPIHVPVPGGSEAAPLPQAVASRHGSFSTMSVTRPLVRRSPSSRLMAATV